MSSETASWVSRPGLSYFAGVANLQPQGDSSGERRRDIVFAAAFASDQMQARCAETLAEAAPRRWIIAASACFCWWLAATGGQCENPVARW